MSPCEICKGACCESFTLRPKMDPDPENFVRWLQYHGELTANGYEFKCKCSQLTAGGKCGVYESRPKLCQDYQVGSLHCRAAVLKHRYKNHKPIFEAIHALQEEGAKA